MASIEYVPFNRLSFKAAHNSYDPMKQPLVRQLNLGVEPFDGGCRGIELDIAQHDPAPYWSVGHGSNYSPDLGDQLGAWLAELARWSAAAGRNHDPVMIHFDLQNAPGSDMAFAETFDRYVRKALGDADIYTPGALLHEKKTLLDAVRAYEWPTLRELRGKFICCLTGNQLDRTWVYLSTALSERLCFCDRNVDGHILGRLFPADQPNRLIYNFSYSALRYITSLHSWPDSTAILYRSYEINDNGSWDKALDLGVNALATDQLFQTPWAMVDPWGQFVQVPDG